MDTLICHLGALVKTWNIDQLFVELAKMRSEYPVYYTDGTISFFPFVQKLRRKVPYAILFKGYWLSVEEECITSEKIGDLEQFSFVGEPICLPMLDDMLLQPADLQKVNRLLLDLGEAPLVGKYWCKQFTGKLIMLEVNRKFGTSISIDQDDDGRCKLRRASKCKLDVLKNFEV